MGQAKKDWMRQDEQGYSDLDGFVCERCIIDEELARYHTSISSSGNCDFCSAANASVASAYDIQRRLMDCLLLDYQDIEQADAPYESREGGYQVSHEPAQDVIRDNCSGEVSDLFLDELADACGFTEWCLRDWAVLSQPERLRYGWEKFCDTVKHRLRFSFAWEPGEEDCGHPDYIDPRGVLETLADYIDSHGLVKTIPAGELVFRVRVDESKVYNSLNEIGSPPHKFAKANRMSPAGITMFYGARDIETALEETWDGTNLAKASIGTFQTTREIRVIDFDNLPPVPSYWNPEQRPSRHALGFLHDFTGDLSAPVERNALVDLPYAPTQIVSEFLTKGRYAPPSHDDPNGFQYPVHGLLFSSSKTGGQNLALNFVHNDDESLGFVQNEYFELINVEHRTLAPEVD